jgi:hypothetical protein
MRKYNYEIKLSKFHGGGHLAYANTLRNAVRAARRDSCTDHKNGCMCGGAQIIDLSGRFSDPDEWTEALSAVDAALRGNRYYIDLCKRKGWE